LLVSRFDSPSMTRFSSSINCSYSLLVSQFNSPSMMRSSSSTNVVIHCDSRFCINCSECRRRRAVNVALYILKAA